LIILSTFLVFVKPGYNQFQRMRQEKKKETAKVNKLEAKLETLKGLDELELTKRSELASKALPLEKQVFQAFAVIERLAQESGVAVGNLSVSPGEIGEESSGGELVFKIDLLGSQEGFKAFLVRLSEIIPLADVKKANLSGSEGLASFSLEFYFSPPPKTIGKVDAPLPKLTASEEEIYSKISNLVDFVPREELVPVGRPAGRENPFAF